MARLPKNANNWPDWIKESLSALRPPDDLTVSQWAEKCRVLDAKTSAAPGPWRNSVTPYLTGIMDAFNDPDIEEIVFCKCTQIGGTEAANNILGYIIAQDPSPTLIVYPTLELAEYTSKNRLQPMFKLSPALREKYTGDESKILELQFDGMYIVLAGSNSAASLASRPIRFLILDEVDKYERNAGKEGDPISLAEERQKTFAANKKTFKTSTPTSRLGNIWRAMERADELRRFYVPCPHCGHYQTLTFDQIKWGGAKEPAAARDAAHYVCEQCHGIIEDRHKQQMLAAGEWRAERKAANSRKVAFHINTIYSPWVRFGDVAYEFLRSKDYPELLMNFVNSWLAEPWEQKETKMDNDLVLEHQSGYEEGEVPADTIILTGGVDVQRDGFYYTIRAWGREMTSYNVAHGQAESWAQIEQIMNMEFADRAGKLYQVNLCAIDSGDQTDDVYDFCAQNQEWAVPVKGSSRSMTTRYSISKIDKGQSAANGLRLYIVDGAQYKDMIAARLQRQPGPGAWLVYDHCDSEYAEQITAEEKIVEYKNGNPVMVWRPKTNHADNHYLDCEVYAALAADLLQIRQLSYMEPEQITEDKSTPPAESNWLGGGDNWLSNKEDWLK